MRTPSLVAGGLLGALLLTAIIGRPEKRPDPARSGTSPLAVSATHVARKQGGPTTRMDRDRTSRLSGTTGGHPREPLPGDFLEQASKQRRLVVTLGNGSSLPLVVTRTTVTGAGSLGSIEGTLTHPARGRFVFHRQPLGALPGRFAGVVFFPTLDYGYRLEADAGQPVLVRSPSEALACIDYHGPEEPDDQDQEAPADHPETILIPSYQNGVLPLQSLPGATGVLYLDFDGQEGPHQGWGDFDAESWNFSNNKIKEIWRRVAEDFAPFNLNVTTDLQSFLAAPETSRQRCIITRTVDAAPDTGGIAFMDTFNWSGDTPCWAFLPGTKTCAEVISHEFGHCLGLRHDGRSNPSETYYSGHGSDETGWAPIMGNSYSKNLTQWSKGEYLNANNVQDDLRRITLGNNAVSYRPDDHGALHLSATPLGFDPAGDLKDEGIVERDGDVDAFLFATTTPGSLDVMIDPVTASPNLDVLAQLYDQSGTLLESSNPADSLNATLTSTVPAGSYTIRITNTAKGAPPGDGYSSYATLGQYILSGTIPAAVLPDFFTIAENSPLDAPVGTVSPRNPHGGNPLSWSLSSSSNPGVFQIDPDSGEITVANPALLDVEALSTGWLDPPEIELTIDLTDTIDSNLDESIRVVITVLDVNEPPTLTDATIEILEHTQEGRALLTVHASDPDEFDLLSFEITAGDPDSRFAIDAKGTLSPASDLSFAEQSSYSLTITTTDSGSPGLSDTATVTIHLIDTVEGYLPGQVEHTIYRNLEGTSIADLTFHPGFPQCPDQIDFRPEVHARGDGENYGRTVRAFLIPPLTGDYTLWIAGDHDCELKLSTGPDPADATTVASFTGWTDFQEWTRYPGQRSASLPLVAGQAYYLEARQKTGLGIDGLSLAWEAKDGSNNTLFAREPIPGLFLAPHHLNYCPDLTVGSASIRENAVPGTFVHDFDAEDLNAGDTHTYSITSGNVGGAFAIGPASGKVTLANTGSLNAFYFLGLTVTDSGTPPLMASTTLIVTVIPAETVAANGPLLEFWDGLHGTTLDTLLNSPLFPDRPARLTELTNFDSGLNLGTNYGARVRAYLTPTATGSYTFYLASDDQSALLLSPDANPANASQIARLNNRTGYHEWDRYPAQQTSAPVSLMAGQRYFIEARFKEGGSGDHLSVGWTGPGFGSITVLDSSVLSPYDSNVAPALSPLESTADLPAAPDTGIAVATFAATDSPFEEITFAIVDGNHANAFAIDPLSGILTVANPADLHSGPYTLTIATQDSGHGGFFPLLTTSTSLTIYLDDADHDSLPDPWEIAQFGSLAEDGPSDTDLDGLSNRGEFLFGTFANNRFSAPSPEATGTVTPTTARFSFRIRNDAWNQAYQLYLSNDMATWLPLGLSEYTVLSTSPLDSLHNRVTVEVPHSGTHCFLRLGVN